jgi:hypothetical protein
MITTKTEVDSVGTTEVQGEHSTQCHNSVVTCKTTDEEKKVPMNKVRVGLAPSSNVKAVKAKVDTWNNTFHRPGESQMKIPRQKRDHSKIQVKWNTVKIRKDTLSLVITEETVGCPASMESRVKLGRSMKILLKLPGLQMRRTFQ